MGLKSSRLAAVGAEGMFALRPEKKTCRKSLLNAEFGVRND